MAAYATFISHIMHLRLFLPLHLFCLRCCFTKFQTSPSIYSGFFCGPFSVTDDGCCCFTKFQTSLSMFSGLFCGPFMLFDVKDDRRSKIALKMGRSGASSVAAASNGKADGPALLFNTSGRNNRRPVNTR